MKWINLTGATITIVDEDEEECVLEPDPDLPPAQITYSALNTKSRNVQIGDARVPEGMLIGIRYRQELPEKKEGVAYIVSPHICKSEVMRDDLWAPIYPVYDSRGNVLYYRGLARNMQGLM